MIEQHWQPGKMDVSREFWNDLMTGEAGSMSIVQRGQDVVAVVWDPTDKAEDIVYAAAISKLPLVMRRLRALLDGDDSQREPLTQILKAMEQIP